MYGNRFRGTGMGCSNHSIFWPDSCEVHTVIDGYVLLGFWITEFSRFWLNNKECSDTQTTHQNG